MAKAADPSFGVLVFGAEGTEGCSALGAVDGRCFDGGGVCDEGGVEVSEGHDDFVGCITRGW